MKSFEKKRWIKVLCGVTLVAALAMALSPVSVKAVPGDDLSSKSEQAAQISREIDALDQQVSVATESFNRVKAELDAVTAKVDDTRRRLDEVRETLRHRRELLNSRAASMYKNGRTSMLEVLLKTKDFADFIERADYVARVTQSDTEMIKRVRNTRDSVAEVERQLAEQQRQQQGLVQQAQATKSDVEGKLAARQALLSSVNKEIQDLLEQERRRVSAESEALAKQAEQTIVTVPEGGLAKTALKYLGVPYHWAGEGPGRCPSGEHRICFDCSGLTQYVYKLYGIDMPHNAAMQFNRGVKIPLAQARPGDLVFFGMPPHHVGMYLGNDMFVHAPQTGDVVKVSKLSARGDLSGVCRFSKNTAR